MADINTLQGTMTGGQVETGPLSNGGSMSLGDFFSLMREKGIIGKTDPAPQVQPKLTVSAGGTPVPEKAFDASNFAGLIDTLRNKITTNNNLADTRTSLMNVLYNRQLTPAEMSKLDPATQELIKIGDKNQIEMNIRLINDQISGRTQSLDKSIDTLTSGYEKSITMAETAKKDAQAIVQSFVTQYGSQAKDALLSIYGPDKVKELEARGGFDLSRISEMPKTIGEQKMLNAASKVADMAGVSPEALQGAIAIYRTGTMPTFGYGQAGSNMRNAFYAAIYANENGGIVGDYLANKNIIAGAASAQRTQSQQYAANQTSIGTLDKQLDLVSQISDQVDRTDSPLVNKYLIGVKTGVFGDPETAKLNNIVTTASMEFAKILSGASASIAGVTVSSASEAKNLLNSAMTKGQFTEIIKLMKQEAEFRLSSQKDSIDRISSDLKELGDTTSNVGTPKVSDTIDVISADGVEGTIPASQKDEALKAGYKLK